MNGHAKTFSPSDMLLAFLFVGAFVSLSGAGFLIATLTALLFSGALITFIFFEQIEQQFDQNGLAIRQVRDRTRSLADALYRLNSVAGSQDKKLSQGTEVEKEDPKAVHFGEVKSNISPALLKTFVA